MSVIFPKALVLIESVTELYLSVPKSINEPSDSGVVVGTEDTGRTGGAPCSDFLIVVSKVSVTFGSVRLAGADIAGSIY